MATTTLYFVSSVAGGSAANPDNALGAPNGSWAGTVNSIDNWQQRWNLDTVEGSATGTQTITLFSVLIRY